MTTEIEIELDDERSICISGPTNEVVTVEICGPDAFVDLGPLELDKLIEALLIAQAVW